MKIGRRLIHYSEKPLATVHSVVQDENCAGFMKPCGLWVSAEGDDDWPSWCRSEVPEWIENKCATEVIFAAGARVLHISTLKAFDAFEVEYVTPGTFKPEYHREQIDWKTVAKKYQAIVISPYMYRRRFGSNLWYYGWDCASGCIWDADAVAELRPLDLKVEAA